MKTINIYEFTELSKEVQEMALKNCPDLFESEYLNDWFKEQLEDIGFYNNLNIYFSLSNCQGDGVCFEGLIKLSDLAKHIDTNKDMLNKLLAYNEMLDVQLEYKGNYTHYNSIDIDFPYNYIEDKELYDFMYGELTDNIRIWLKHKCYEFERDGYKEIDYVNSDEYKFEFFINNEIYFYNNGDQIKYCHQKEVI